MNLGILMAICGGLLLLFLVIGTIIIAMNGFPEKQQRRELDRAYREMIEQMDEDVKRAG